MKTKSLTIIFIVFLSITLASGLAVFLTKEKNQPLLSQPADRTIEPVQAAASSTKNKKIAEPVKNSSLNLKPKETVKPETAKRPVEEKIKAVMIVDDNKYKAEVKPGSSVYDLMIFLKVENKIDFSGEYYAGLGFFVQALTGRKNDPAGKNWLYYINGQPAPVGVSGYELKNNDIIEWKYENKSF